jgi:DNA replication terminus site-binding protein
MSEVFTNQDFRLMSQIKEEFFHLVEHVDSLNAFLHSHTDLTATVFEMPVGNVDDVGMEHIDVTPRLISGRQAIELALMHFSDFRMHLKQAGVMSKRLPGIVFVNTDNEHELQQRVTLINQKKDEFMSLVQSVSKSHDEQFEMMKNAVPMVIRKAIGRHIPCYQSGVINRIRFSMSRRSSMSKAQLRNVWLEKLDRSRKYVAGKVDVESWLDQIDIEQRHLSSLPEDALLRIERPLRKVPIANVFLEEGTKTTLVAHSPILIMNDTFKVKGFRPYKGNAKGEEAPREPIIPRWHLYLKSPLNR